MDLETIEQRCLEFLQQSANPMVPVSVLLRWLQRHDDYAGVTERELLDFLRKHDLFRVIDASPMENDPAEMARLAEAGIVSGPRVILRTRIPTQSEMVDLINSQLASMIDALQKALKEAAVQGRNDAEEKIAEALARAERLQEEARNVFKKRS